MPIKAINENKIQWKTCKTGSNLVAQTSPVVSCLTFQLFLVSLTRRWERVCNLLKMSQKWKWPWHLSLLTAKVWICTSAYPHSLIPKKVLRWPKETEIHQNLSWTQNRRQTPSEVGSGGRWLKSRKPLSHCSPSWWYYLIFRLVAFRLISLWLLIPDPESHWEQDNMVTRSVDKVSAQLRALRSKTRTSPS